MRFNLRHSKSLPESVGDVQRFLVESGRCSACAAGFAMVRRDRRDGDTGFRAVGDLFDLASDQDDSEWCGCDKSCTGHQQRKEIEFHW